MPSNAEASNRITDRDAGRAVVRDQAVGGGPLDIAPYPIVDCDREGHVLFANPASRSAFPDLAEGSADHPFTRISPEELAALDASGRPGIQRDLQVGEHWLRQTIFAVPGTQRIRIHGLDVGDEWRAYARSLLLNRLLRTLLHANRIFASATERDPMLADICAAMVATGGFRTAWVGLADLESGRVTPVAHAGEGRDYVWSANIRCDDTPHGRGPTGTAIRTGKHGICWDMATAPQFAPWSAAAQSVGFRASGAFPIPVRGRIVGALSVYTDDPGMFGDEMLELLGQLAADIGRAILSLENAHERECVAHTLRETTAALYDSEANYRALFDSSPQPLWVVDATTLAFLAANDAAVTNYGYSRDEFLQMSVRDIEPDGETATQCGRVSALPGDDDFQFESRHLRNHADPIDVNVSGRGLRFAGHAAWLVLATDITQRKKAEEELVRSFDQVHSLAQRLQVIREQERTSVAREVHDELGQSLTGLKMDLAWMQRQLIGAQDVPSPNPVVSRLEEMSGLVDGTIATVRRIATELRPGVLDTLGLVAAIDWQSRDFQQRSQIVCTFRTNAGDIALGRDCSTAIFRILQEALTNVARHARATRVRLILHAQPSAVRLDIADNGVGISEEALGGSTSLGLLGMRERAMVFGGEVRITGRPGRGTRVSLLIPCPCANGGCPQGNTASPLRRRPR